MIRGATASRLERATSPPAPNPLPNPWMIRTGFGRTYLAEHARMVWHRDEFHVWRESAYRPMPSKEVNLGITRIAKTEFDRAHRHAVQAWEQRGRKDLRGRECPPPTVHKVGTHLIADVNQAVGAMTMISGRIEPPVWLIDNPPFPATDVMPMRNALVHLPSHVDGKPGAIAKPTPGFFCPYALDYDFDPQAPEPSEWIKFLESVWPKADGSELALQEWFGYLLTPDKRQHKMAMLIGPPRSGRGTICRVIKKLARTRQRRQPDALGTGRPVRRGVLDRQARGHHRRCTAVEQSGLGRGSGTDPGNHGR